MARSLSLYLCQTFEREAVQIAQNEGWKDIELHFLPTLCSQVSLKDQVESILRQAYQADNTDSVTIGCYPNCLNRQDIRAAGVIHNLAQCHYLLLPPGIVDELIQKNHYLISPGWLKEWRHFFNQWGLDQPTARMMFQETTSTLLLLDTGIDPAAKSCLAEIGSYLDLPTAILPVGLEYMSAYLFRVVSEWQHRQDLIRIETAVQEIRRKSADYAMAMDLLTNLTRVMNEKKVISEIIDLFTMLFSAQKVTYLPVVNQKVHPRGDHSITAQELSLIQEWVSAPAENYRLTTDRAGFYLKLHFREELLGILSVQGLSLPEYITQYINLSLSIIQLCGLAISNARMYRELQEAERVAKREYDISETLRKVMEELVTQHDLEKVLTQTLASLNRVMHYSSAVIYLQIENQLVYHGGIQVTGDLMLEPIQPSPALIRLDAAWIPDNPRTLQDLPESIRQQIVSIHPGIRSWLGIPLKFRERSVGVLSIGSYNDSAFSQRDLELAQTFANEVTIAIENARLFEEIRTLAITDGLTGLFNRRHFFELAKIEFNRASRYHCHLSAMMLDVDYFKRINDTYGHIVGDKVLVEIAKLCRSQARSSDIVGRYGGEEIIFLLTETEQEGASRFANRIREQIETMTISQPDAEIKVTVSLGIAFIDASCSSLDELLRRSDEALYAAKQAGRNCLRVYPGTTWR